MFEQNDKLCRETDFCFALTVALFNFLLLSVVIGTIWVWHFLLTQPNWLGAALSEYPK